MIITSPITLAQSPARQTAQDTEQVTWPRPEAGYKLEIAFPSTMAAPVFIAGKIPQSQVAGISEIGLIWDPRAVVRVPPTPFSQLIGFDGITGRINTPSLDNMGGTDALSLTSDVRTFLDERGNFLICYNSLNFTPTALAFVSEAAVTIEWVISASILAVIYPTIAGNFRLFHPRVIEQTITGQHWVTARSQNPVLERLDVPLLNDWRDYLAGDLAQLDTLNQFAVWPAGLESIFRTQLYGREHRQHDFVRVMAISNWSGWNGWQGVDVHGASGIMRFSEIPWPTDENIQAPVLTRRPTLPGTIARITETNITPTVPVAALQMEWEGGIIMEWKALAGQNPVPMEWAPAP